MKCPKCKNDLLIMKHKNNESESSYDNVYCCSFCQTGIFDKNKLKEMREQNRKYVLCKQCKKRMYIKSMCSCDYECSLTNGGLCGTCEERQHYTYENEEDGAFYCRKCDIRTNQKTIWTTCVICKEKLQRLCRD